MADDGYTGDFQCMYCNRFYAGPHTGLAPDMQASHITPDGTLFERADDAHPMNISHGICPDCDADPPWRREQRELHRQRFKRGK
jgi:hypothetical protein